MAVRGGGGGAPSGSLCVEKLGGIAYAAKTLDGLFFSHAGELLLLSGTEVHNGRGSQVFVYCVNRDEIITSQYLEGSMSMTAFCDGGDGVYFATISPSMAGGCDLYSYNKNIGEIRTCAHFEEKGIYTLCWNGGPDLFVATSYPTNVYAYNLASGSVRTVCTSPTNEPFIRSMSIIEGILYLGIGTKADLIEVDLTTGTVRSVLPEIYCSNSYIYTIAPYGGKLALFLSPSHTILEFDPQTGSFTDTEILHQERNSPIVTTPLSVQAPYTGSYVNLLGTLLLTEGNTIIGEAEQEGKVVYLVVRKI